MKIKIQIVVFTILSGLLIGIGTVIIRNTSAAATITVDDDGAQCPGAAFTSIQNAINAASPGDTIQVCAGNYNGDVNVNKSLTLNGAQAGVSVTGRTFGGASESKVQGTNLTASIATITITASNVTIDGFSVTKTVTSGAAHGIMVFTNGDGAVIKNNIIDTVTSPDPGGQGTAQAVYLANSTASNTGGADNVSILNNKINNIQSNRSAKGVLIGDNNGINASQNTLIQNNSITNVTSTTRGAYGISVANPLATSGGVSGLQIRDNTINGLNSGGWVHAIGLEGNTPGVTVENNDISNLVNANPDNIAVYFDSNSSFSTAEVHDNNFNLTSASFGIAVNPALSGGAVDGACNWWGSASGPGPIGPGTGALVSANVIYTPWQTAPNGACVGPDADNDGVTDSADNCPNTPNADQTDTDNDGQGNACDPDDDGDGVPDGTDNCALTPNTNQANNDGDAFGDVCDADDDNDGVNDNVDNCPFTPNANQADNDNDGIGDVCDADDDNDGVLDGPDNCDFTANPSQTDTDNDGIGNACDADDDNDGVADGPDNCDLTPNPNQADIDQDGIGDACDPVIGPPTNQNQCKNNGWQFWTRANGTKFKNQGDCIQYVNTGK